MKKEKLKRSLVLWLFVLYMASIFYLVLVKDILSAYFNPFGIKVTGFSTAFERINIIPLKTLYYYLSGKERFETGLINIGGNILLFIPFGLFTTLLFNENRLLRQTLKLSFLVSLLLELVQLAFGLGTCDIDDVLLNVGGGSLGFLILNLLLPASNRLRLN